MYPLPLAHQTADHLINRQTGVETGRNVRIADNTPKNKAPDL
jgi:hypothetical protein